LLAQLLWIALVLFIATALSVQPDQAGDATVVNGSRKPT
jgi:hypothetical protein